jgi:hypothetical protein
LKGLWQGTGNIPGRPCRQKSKGNNYECTVLSFRILQITGL